MSILQYLIAPVIGAIIGWFTNYLAVRMLFHPRRQISILGFKLQGVFPARQKVLANKIAELVSRELIDSKDIQDIIRADFSDEKIRFKIDQFLNRMISEKLADLSPMLSMFLSPEFISKIKESLIVEILKVKAEMLLDIDNSFNEKFDIKKIVQDKIENFEPEKVEQLILEVMKRELTFVELTGAVLGFLIGIIQLVLQLSIT